MSFFKCYAWRQLDGWCALNFFLVTVNGKWNSRVKGKPYNPFRMHLCISTK